MNNKNMPFYIELRSIVLKTFGLADVIRQGLNSINGIRLAFIYGSIAKQEDTATSDIYLMIIGNDLTYADLFPILEEIELNLIVK